jgi:transposase InsO family protein
VAGLGHRLPRRDLIGRRYGQSADTQLCLGALHDAVRERFPDQLDRLKQAAPKLSHDWGSQFTSRATRPSYAGSPSPTGR